MELDGLKNTWIVHTSEPKSNLIISKSSVENMLKQRAEHSRRKIIRLMGLDAGLMIVVNCVFIAVLYYLGFQSRHLYALIILAIMLLLFVHYHFNMIVVQKTSSHKSVYMGIRATIGALKRYFKIYKSIFPLFIFLTLFGTQYLNLLDLSPFIGVENSVELQIGSSILFSFFGYLALAVIISSIYKKDLSALQNLERELTE